MIIINNILDKDAKYEQKHGIFSLLSLTYLTQNNDLQFHPISCK
jgi:hypothetical protein